MTNTMYNKGLRAQVAWPVTYGEQREMSHRDSACLLPKCGSRICARILTRYGPSRLRPCSGTLLQQMPFIGNEYCSQLRWVLRCTIHVFARDHFYSGFQPGAAIGVRGPASSCGAWRCSASAVCLGAIAGPKRLIYLLPLNAPLGKVFLAQPLY